MAPDLRWLGLFTPPPPPYLPRTGDSMDLPQPVPEHTHNSHSHSHWSLWFVIFMVANGGFDCRGVGGRVEKLEAKIQRLDAQVRQLVVALPAQAPAPALSAEPQPEIVEGFEIVAP